VSKGLLVFIHVPRYSLSDVGVGVGVGVGLSFPPPPPPQLNKPDIIHKVRLQPF